MAFSDAVSSEQRALNVHPNACWISPRRWTGEDQGWLRDPPPWSQSTPDLMADDLERLLWGRCVPVPCLRLASCDWPFRHECVSPVHRVWQTVAIAAIAIFVGGGFSVAASQHTDPGQRNHVDATRAPFHEERLIGFQPKKVDVTMGRTLRWPSATAWRDTLYIVGNVVPTDITTKLDVRPAKIVRVPGDPIDLPPGDFLFAYPKGVFTSSGTYHLFWAEPDERNANGVAWSPANFRTLWHSRLLNGSWSEPEPIFRGARVIWGAEQGMVAVDDDQTIHVVLPGSAIGAHAATFYLRGNVQGWAVREFPFAAAYVSIAISQPDSLFVAFTAPDRSVQSDGNSVFVMTSPDMGTSWTVPVLVQRSGRRAATRPLILRSEDGTLHLVWVQNVTRDRNPEVVRHWIRSPSSSHWTSLPDAPIVGTILQIVAAPDRCGGVGVLVEAVDRARISLFDIHRSGRWVSVERLFPEWQISASPGLASTGDKIHLFWTGLTSANRPPVAFIASRPVCNHGTR